MCLGTLCTPLPPLLIQSFNYECCFVLCLRTVLLAKCLGIALPRSPQILDAYQGLGARKPCQQHQAKEGRPCPHPHRSHVKAGAVGDSWVGGTGQMGPRALEPAGKLLSRLLQDSSRACASAKYWLEEDGRGRPTEEDIWRAVPPYCLSRQDRLVKA